MLHPGAENSRRVWPASQQFNILQQGKMPRSAGPLAEYTALRRVEHSVADSLQPPFRLITLGRLALLDAHGREEPTLASRRRKLAVLAVLAEARRPLGRDTVIDMFWGERDEERARNSLSDALSHLRRVLGRAALPAYRDEIGLAHESRLAVDLLELRSAAARGDHARVVALYAGPFLDGVHVDDAPRFEDWRDRIRAEADTAFVRAAAAECDRLARTHADEERAQLARRWLGVEPAATEAALHLLAAVAAPGTRGARVAAVREYHALADRLRRDFDIAPAAAVGARAADLADGLTEPAFDLPTVPAESAAPAASPTAESPAGLAAYEPRARRALWFVLAAAAALVAGAALLMMLVRPESVAAPAVAGDVANAATARSVAVMRFRNIGGDSADQYFSDGMAEEVMHAIARIEGVQVAARSASFALSDDDMHPREIGHRLRVATVLEGSVRRAGDLLRVSVRLVNATSGFTLWQESYDRTVTEVFAVQEEVAHAVAAALRVELQREDERRARRASTDFETYDLYLRGRYVWWTSTTEEGVRRSIADFRRALARDSTFAPAWVGLADALLRLTSNYDIAPADVVAPAREALLHAIALDPYLPDAHATFGYLATFHDHQWTDAEASFLRALELDARHANARLWYAWMLTARGRHDEAVVQVRHAHAYEPLSRLLRARLATMLYFARDYEGAVRQADASIEADSTFWLPYRQKGEALVQMGRAADALAPMQKAAAMSPTGETRARYAYALARAGHGAEARDILAELVSSTAAGYVSPVELARVHVGLADQNRALALLEQALELGASTVVLVNVEPAFDQLRGEPRFLRIVRQLAL
jgi:TolB-like protein/DNA-binding SARP family transcriptional activator/Flp pilus assembly protein TadD